MDDQPSPREPDPAHTPLFTRYRRTQLIVVIASVICILLFSYAGGWLHIPAPRGFDASILQQNGWPLDIIAIYVLLGVAAAIGTLVAGRSWFFAGLFTATVGLMALSIRGGPMRYVLFRAGSEGTTRSVFLQLGFEQCLLFVPLGLMWMYFHRKYLAALPPTESGDRPPAAGSMVTALLTQLAITAFLVLLLTPTDAKKQVLISLFISGFVGAAFAESLVPCRKAWAWYWLAPFGLGILGYAAAFLNASDFTTGTANGFLAHLAYPLPLDYASAGLAGALLGCWSSAEQPETSVSILRVAMRVALRS